MNLPSDSEHFEKLLESLSENIARLAQACNIDLNQPGNVEHILHHDLPDQHHLLEELRGLLTLRYLEEKRIADNLGSDVCMELLVRVENHMRDKGFRAGSDGFDPGMLVNYYRAQVDRLSSPTSPAS